MILIQIAILKKGRRKTEVFNKKNKSLYILVEIVVTSLIALIALLITIMT